MSNPGELISFQVKLMTVTDWARHFGINPVTLRARIRRYGMSIERAMTSDSLALTSSGKWYKVAAKESRDYEHRVIASKALGKLLPKGVEIHHVDGNPLNNAPSNLVICPNHGYHALLHIRTKALDESGNANNRKCTFCGVWSPPGEIKISASNSAYHSICHARYHRERRHALNKIEE